MLYRLRRKQKACHDSLVSGHGHHGGGGGGEVSGWVKDKSQFYISVGQGQRWIPECGTSYQPALIREENACFMELIQIKRKQKHHKNLEQDLLNLIGNIVMHFEHVLWYEV